MENKKVVKFLETKNQEKILTKKERHLETLILNVEKIDKRIEAINKVPVGKNFHCACGCGKECIKKNNGDKFGRISGEKNCKDKYHGRKREIIRTISKLSKDQLKQLKDKSEKIKEIIERTEEKYKLEINKLKNQNKRKNN